MATVCPITFKQYEGIYEVPEAARYIFAAEHMKYKAAAQSPGHVPYNISSRHLIRWLHKGLALEGLSSVPGGEILMTFEDMISMRVIAALRVAGVRFPLIYKAENWLRSETGQQRPFAVEALWTLPTSPRGSGDRVRAEVFAILRSKLVDASRAGQAAFDFFRDYIVPVHGLTFENEVAASWEPLPGVLLLPEIQFGAPCIKGTRVPTRTIWGMIAAGDTRDYVARSFKINDTEIDAALGWEESIAA
jgi:uncharacterized protein (DUF433 family)